jgi:CarboxypepD_reg-like domain
MKSKHYTSALFRIAIASLFIIFFSAQAFAQNTQTIRGIVKSGDDNQPVPGTNIYLKSLSSVGTFSDANGEFQFPRQLKSGDVLVFSFLGLKTTEYAVPDQPVGSIAITMPIDPIQMVDEILVEGDEPANVVVSTKRIRKTKVNR